MLELDTIHHLDLVSLCGQLDPESVDMILSQKQADHMPVAY